MGKMFQNRNAKEVTDCGKDMHICRQSEMSKVRDTSASRYIASIPARVLREFMTVAGLPSHVSNHSARYMQS